jgi:putative glycosyltransferase (TIGR04372 family)
MKEKNRSLTKKITTSLMRSFVLGYVRLKMVIELSFKVSLNIRELRRSNLVLFYPEGGFGHTIHIPDHVRRMSTSSNWIVLFAYVPRRHSREIEDLWGREHFCWINSGVYLPNLGIVFDAGFNKFIFELMARILYVLLNRNIYWRDKFVKKNYFNAERYLLSRGMYINNSLPNHVLELPYYISRLETSPALDYTLNFLIKNRIYRKIFQLTDKKRVCGLFIRRKNTSGVDIRDGSNPEEYSSAIQFLNSKGFVVLLYGDLSANNFFIGLDVIDSIKVSEPKGLFSIFIGTEAEFIVGQASGASLFSSTHNKPSLLINFFPIGDVIPGATILYKSYFVNGHKISFNQAFSEYYFDWKSHDAVVVPNTSEEIMYAVEMFFDDVYCQGSNYFTFNDIEFSNHNLVKGILSGARFSNVNRGVLHDS